MDCNLNPDDVRIFSGRSHPELAASIAFHLAFPWKLRIFLALAMIIYIFSSGQVYVPALYILCNP